MIMNPISITQKNNNEFQITLCDGEEIFTFKMVKHNNVIIQFSDMLQIEYETIWYFYNNNDEKLIYFLPEIDMDLLNKINTLQLEIKEHFISKIFGYSINKTIEFFGDCLIKNKYKYVPKNEIDRYINDYYLSYPVVARRYISSPSLGSDI